jgi:single-strand DNA-binding protein
MDINKVILKGRMTADPEVRKTANGLSVVPFTVAVNRRKKDDPCDFIDCVAWRQAADYIGQYGRKGSTVEVIGRMQKRSYTKGDRTVYVVEVIADEVGLEKSSSDYNAVEPVPAIVEEFNIGEPIDIDPNDLPF